MSHSRKRDTQRTHPTHAGRYFLLSFFRDIPSGQTGRYKSGVVRFSIGTGAPIVPIAVNSGEFWPKKAFLKKPGLITVSIGKPIEPAGRDPEDLNAEVKAWIESEMRLISPHSYQHETTAT